MKEYVFEELGYFTEKGIERIKNVMEGKTFMNFHISCSNQAGNCILIVSTDSAGSQEEIKNFFLNCALNKI